MEEKAVQCLQREAVLSNRESLRAIREMLLANVVMAAEIPAPTGSERLLTRFLSDRFTEAGLTDIANDQAGNIAAVLPGRDHSRNILVAAHVDKVWPESDDHTVSVGVGSMRGRGIADNSLGVAVLATLPLILERLSIALEANLILLGTTRSFGRGDLAGMRFFLENTDREIDGALCVEGMNLGRLSFSSLGMARGEIVVELAGGSEDPDLANAGVIAVLQKALSELLQLNRTYHPDVKILIGTVDSVSGYNVPPLLGKICFEIRSREAERVAEVERLVQALVEKLHASADQLQVTVEIIARRVPGDLGEGHPLVKAARHTLGILGVEARPEPSISELAALLESGIPSLTLGVTKGEGRHSSRETIQLDRMPDGLAQIVSVLQFMDSGGCD
jgi:acetylornithine deacetylase/succinyl-diaminopimelate desuccinylase-like protein